MKKIPMRTCVMCRQQKDKRELMRIVRTPEGKVAFDPTGKANGRGAYVCSSEECLGNIKNIKKIASALSAEVNAEELNAVFEEVKRYINKTEKGGNV